MWNKVFKNNKEMVKDPVCGMVKPKDQMKSKYNYKGLDYYFCTKEDRDMFKAYPDKWLPRDQEGGA